MINEQRLVNSGLCCSFAEAKRIISKMSEEKILSKLIEKENDQWGRRRSRQKTKVMWPKKIIEIE